MGQHVVVKHSRPCALCLWRLVTAACLLFRRTAFLLCCHREEAQRAGFTHACVCWDERRAVADTFSPRLGFTRAILPTTPPTVVTSITPRFARLRRAPFILRAEPANPTRSGESRGGRQYCRHLHLRAGCPTDGNHTCPTACLRICLLPTARRSPAAPPALV